MLQANRNRAFNKGLSIEEVDREFMKPNKYFIKHILKGDHKAKVFEDAKIYKDFVSYNSKLVKKHED